MKKSTSIGNSSMPPLTDDDPFGGYDLPDEAPKAPKAPTPPSAPTAPAKADLDDRAPWSFLDDPPSTPTAPAKEDQQIEAKPSRRDWQPSDFEHYGKRSLQSCAQCMHYVKGGSLAVDHVPNLRYCADSAGYDLITECREFEKEFELRELQQIVDKARTLDTHFDEIPRIRHYCIAGSLFGMRVQIPEIKNHDGSCADFFPGPRPLVRCEKCKQCRAARVVRRSGAELCTGMDDYYDLMRDPDVSPDQRSRIGIGYLNEHARIERLQEQRQHEYDSKLQADVREAILDLTWPSEDTLDTCNASASPFHGFACAVANRSLSCPWYTEGEAIKSLADHERKLQLEPNPGYAQWVKEGRAHRLEERPALLHPECFDCDHVRSPADIDPFATIYFRNSEVLQLRDTYKRDKKKREIDERRICTRPGLSIGDPEVPVRQVWCDKYSKRGPDGRVQEFAFCYRVIKNNATDCQCAGFEHFKETRARHDATLVCGRCNHKPSTLEIRDGKTWCTWCSGWAEPKKCEEERRPVPDPENWDQLLAKARSLLLERSRKK